MRDVGGHLLTQAVLLGQLVAHLVEGLGQLADFVIRRNLDLLFKFTGTHALCCLG